MSSMRNPQQALLAAGPSNAKPPPPSPSKPSSKRATRPSELKAHAKKQVPVVKDEPTDEDEVEPTASLSPEDDPDVGEDEIDPDEDLDDKEGAASQK